MMVLVCTSEECGSFFRIVGEPEDVATLVGFRSSVWPAPYVCPVCGSVSRLAPEHVIDASALAGLPVRMLEAKEAFQALQGLGLPEEQECSRDVIEGLLREHPIRKVSGHSVANTKTFCLEHLELWDGTRLDFGASTHGAVVYRIVRPKAKRGVDE